MKLDKFVIFSSVLMMALSCVEEPEINVNPQPGSDVQFGLSLGDGLETRTIYGTETATGFPVYWVDGDKVLVASPQCQEGRNSAEYAVSCSAENQQYADQLTKTGAYGVQWGETESADFYSIYPSTGSSLIVNSDNDGVVANLQVASTQYASISEVNNVYFAQPKDMGNVMMYAYTPGAPNDGKTPVNLTYKPFSTVFEFTLTVPTTAAANTVADVTIQSITLTAPEGVKIAGDFTFNFPDADNSEPSITASTTGMNAVTLHFLEDNVYTTSLTPTKNTLKAKMCIMPIDGVESMEGWTVTVAASTGVFSRTFAEADASKTALTPGKVHKISLPVLAYGSKEWEYSLGNWITSLPDYKNIYLTEISLPGAWYAGGEIYSTNRYGDDESYKNYQATNDIATMWGAGVRAFAVETRTGTEFGQTKPSSVFVSGTGSEQALNVTSYNSLHGETGNSATGYRSGDDISSIITSIASQVATSDEFAVLVLSYADGGSGGHRYVDYGAWLQLLSTTFANLSDETKNAIYQEKITENTTVNDVIGKLILKINVDENIALEGTVESTTYSYTDDLPALFSYNRFVQQIGDVSNPYFSPLYWKDWEDSDTYRKDSSTYGGSGFTWCFSSANRTQLDIGTDTDIPTYSQRKSALNTMMTQSKKIYDASTHNVWFYFNCGGTQAESLESEADPTNSPTFFAKTMNKWLYETILAKTDPSPLGIVMFNQCTGDDATYYGERIIQEIIEMNSKFYLKHAGDNTTNNTSNGATQQSVPISNGAYALVGDDAF